MNKTLHIVKIRQSEKHNYLYSEGVSNSLHRQILPDALHLIAGVPVILLFDPVALNKLQRLVERLQRPHSARVGCRGEPQVLFFQFRAGTHHMHFCPVHVPAIHGEQRCVDSRHDAGGGRIIIIITTPSPPTTTSFSPPASTPAGVLLLLLLLLLLGPPATVVVAHHVLEAGGSLLKVSVSGQVRIQTHLTALRIEVNISTRIRSENKNIGPNQRKNLSQETYKQL